MRCAAADIFGAVASRPQYRRHARIQPELAEIITAMQRSAVYEQWPKVKVCLMNAAGQFDSKEIVPVIQAGKRDFDFNVRNAAQDAERIREQRLRDEGIRPNEK
jgi:hypothetical protein